MGNITSISGRLRGGGLALIAMGLAVGLASCASAPDPTEPGFFKRPLSSAPVTSSFGPRNGRPHYGVDYGAQRGTPVAAAGPGRVTFAGRQEGFGKIVIISHGEGFETYYAHLSRISVRKGKQVDRGDRIGRVGKTGRATGPHLHFEIRQGGRPIDPATLL